jgi:hypothetical protein
MFACLSLEIRVLVGVVQFVKRGWIAVGMCLPHPSLDLPPNAKNWGKKTTVVATPKHQRKRGYSLHRAF